MTLNGTLNPSPTSQKLKPSLKLCRGLDQGMDPRHEKDPGT